MSKKQILERRLAKERLTEYPTIQVAKQSNKTTVENRLESIKRNNRVNRKARSPDGMTVNWNSFGDLLGKAVPENLFKSKAKRKRKTFKRWGKK